MQSARPACLHWQNFRCTYGDACNFSHEGPGGPADPSLQGMAIQPVFCEPALLEQPMAMKPRPLCNHWQQFRCNYGDACNFSHDGPGGPSPLGIFPSMEQAADGAALAAQAAALMVPGGELSGELSGVIQPPAEASLSSPEVFLEGPRGRVCIHWQQFRCSYGDSCNFSHDGPGGPDTRGAWAAGGVPGSMVRGGGIGLQVGSIKPVWAAPGQGAAFAQRQAGAAALALTHTTASLGPGGVSSTLCKHFLVGRCNFGDLCRFSHASESPGAGVSPMGPYPGVFGVGTAPTGGGCGARWTPY